MANEKPWTAEAITFVHQLQSIDSSLATWAELRIDGEGATVASLTEELRAAMRIAEPLREADKRAEVGA